MEIEYSQIENIKTNLLNSNKTNNSIIYTKNVYIQYCELDYQKNYSISNLSNIDLGQCEDIIKSINHIPKEESLLIFKADIKVQALLTTYVEYEIYNPLTLEPLNLSDCNNKEIYINVPVDNNTSLDVYYDSLLESGYDLFDKKNYFYNDICSKYTSPYGTDMLLSDRKKDIYNKSNIQYLCQKGCKLHSYNSETHKVQCDCDSMAKNSDSFDFDDIGKYFQKDVIYDNFFETLSNSNFLVLKCFRLIFKPGFLRNYGLIFMLIIFCFFIISFCLFIFQCKKQIVEYGNLVIKSVQKNSNKIKSKKGNKKKFLNNTKTLNNISNIYKIKKRKKTNKIINQPPHKKNKSDLNVTKKTIEHLIINKNLKKTKTPIYLDTSGI